MPFNATSPRFVDMLRAAHREAQGLIDYGIYKAGGRSFQDLAAPPPLRTIAQVYFNVMRENFRETVRQRGEAFAERDAGRRGGHAAEILSPTGASLGYTFYHDAENPDHSLS